MSSSYSHMSMAQHVIDGELALFKEAYWHSHYSGFNEWIQVY